MDIVALMSLGTSVEQEAPLLAPELGETVYETTLLLRTPPPVPLLRTDDRARAVQLVERLRGRGHDAVACDAAAIIPAGAMTHVSDFRFQSDALTVTSHRGTHDHVAWGDIVAFVRATYRVRVEYVQKTQQRQSTVARTGAIGIRLARKTVTSSTIKAEDARDQVLYMFRRQGAPLLARLTRTQYDGLGPRRRIGQLENFTSFIQLLREHAPRAPYDERLLAARPGRIRAGSTPATAASSPEGVDLLAHLIALSLSGNAQPYR